MSNRSDPSAKVQTVGVFKTSKKSGDSDPVIVAIDASRSTTDTLIISGVDDLPVA